MNLFELIILLIIGSGIGALIGGAIGFFTSTFANGASHGALLGPCALLTLKMAVLFWAYIKHNTKHKNKTEQTH